MGVGIRVDVGNGVAVGVVVGGGLGVIAGMLVAGTQDEISKPNARRKGRKRFIERGRKP
jgi:hypothetical protein